MSRSYPNLCTHRLAGYKVNEKIFTGERVGQLTLKSIRGHGLLVLRGRGRTGVVALLGVRLSRRSGGISCSHKPALLALPQLLMVRGQAMWQGSAAATR